MIIMHLKPKIPRGKSDGEGNSCEWKESEAEDVIERGGNQQFVSFQSVWYYFNAFKLNRFQNYNVKRLHAFYVMI